MLRCRILLLGTMTGILWPLSAAAEGIVLPIVPGNPPFVAGSGSATADDENEQFFSPLPPSAVPLHVNVGAESSDGSEIGQASGTAQLGSLSGNATAGASCPTCFANVAGASLDLFFGDSAMVTSVNLSVGTLVPFEVALFFHGSAGFTQDGADASVSVLLEIQSGGGFPFFLGDGDNGTNPATQGRLTPSVFMTCVGCRITFEEGLGLEAEARDGSADANAIDTAGFFLAPLTPGVSYVTASGQTYDFPSAAPELSSLALCATGLLCLLTLGLRHRQQSVVRKNTINPVGGVVE